MYRTPRIFVATPVELETERLQFDDIVSRFCEKESMAAGVLYVPVTLPPVRDKRRLKAVLNDTIRECRHYVLTLANGWGPEDRNFREDYLLAMELMADRTAELQTVTVLAKGRGGPETPKPHATFSTPQEFEEVMTGLMRGWLAEMPEPVEETTANAVAPGKVLEIETPPDPPIAESVMTVPSAPAEVPLPDAEPSVSEPEICFACGFCCDGTLYPSIAILPGDSPQFLINIGLEPVLGAEGETTAFTQPCSQFNGTCAAYEVGRPVACATYRCRLLRSVAAGMFDKDEALRIVGEAKALKEESSIGLGAMMQEAQPGYDGVTAISHAACLGRVMGEPERRPFRERYGEVSERVLRFVEYLNTYFLPGF